MKKYGIIVLVIGLIALLGFAFAAEKAATKAKVDPMAEKQALAKAVKVSMADALATASKKVSGTVLNAEVEDENGKIIYSFEILPTLDSKEIKEINIDAATGAIIAEETENNQTEAKEKAADAKETKVAKGEKGEKDEEGETGEKDEKGEKGKEEGKWEALKIKVDVAKLPAPVKSAVHKEIAGAKIVSASTMPKIYSVKVTKGEESSELLVTSAGKVIENEISGKESDEKDEKGEADEKGEKGEKDEKD